MGIGVAMLLVPPVLAVHELTDDRGVRAAGWIGAGLAVIASLIGFGWVYLQLGRRLDGWRAPWDALAIGSDGIRFGGLWRCEWVPWSDIGGVRVDPRGDAVVLELDGAAPRRVPVPNADRVANDVRDSIAEWRRSSPAPAIPELRLDARSEPEIERWQRRARGVWARDPYRAGAVGAETLVAIVADPRAATDQRIGAALALATASGELRARVHDAIDATANPALATAMREALAGYVDPTVVALACNIRGA